MTPTVLVIDDSLTVRMDLQEALEGLACEVVLASTLAAAREQLATRRFSLVVLDILLPDGDGISLLTEIRNAPRHAALPVILLSTEAAVRDRVRGLSTGANEYLGKPYDRARLLSRANALIQRGDGEVWSAHEDDAHVEGCFLGAFAGGPHALSALSWHRKRSKR